MKTQAEYAADLATDAGRIISKLYKISFDIEKRHSGDFYAGLEQAAATLEGAILNKGAELSADTKSPLLVWATECFGAVGDADVVGESTLRLYGKGAQPFVIDIPLNVMFDEAIYCVHASWGFDTYPFQESFSLKLGNVVKRHLEVVA